LFLDTLGYTNNDLTSKNKAEAKILKLYEREKLLADISQLINLELLLSLNFKKYYKNDFNKR